MRRWELLNDFLEKKWISLSLNLPMKDLLRDDIDNFDIQFPFQKNLDKLIKQGYLTI